MLGSRMATPAPFRSATTQRVAPRMAARVTVMPSFSNMLSGLSLGERSEGTTLVAPSNGMGVTMMRHGNKVKHLGRPADQRKALVRSLVTEVIRHGAIRTTKIKAKVIRSHVDHMITLAKDGSLHARRQALGFLFDPTLVSRLFDQVPERYGSQNGGYCRIKTEPQLRRGDASEMAVLELV